MKKKILASTIGLAMCLSAAVSGCGSSGSSSECTDSAAPENSETIYQVALLQSLVQGYYDGVIPVDELKEHGDTGIGTFDGVNGEMIVLDGDVYRAAGDGTVEIAPGDETVPFSNVTFFETDGTVELSGIADMSGLQAELGKVVEENGSNMFYMVKLNGDFSKLKVRSEPKQERPYKMLDEALAETQVEFDLENIKGTMIGLYCPDYVSGLNSVGWHFHFISDDRTKGGHVLAVSAEKLEASYDVTSGFNMYLPDENGFQSLDLAKDVDEAIKSAETKTNDD